MQFLLFFQEMSNEQLNQAIKADPMGWTTYLVPFTYWFVIIVAIIAIVMSVMNMVKNPENLKSFFLGLLALVVLFLLCWMLSTSTVPEDIKDLVTPARYKLIGGGLMTAGVLASIGLLILLFDLVRGVYKN